MKVDRSAVFPLSLFSSPSIILFLPPPYHREEKEKEELTSMPNTAASPNATLPLPLHSPCSVYLPPLFFSQLSQST